MNENILVQVDHLTKYFPIKGQKGPGVQAVEDVSFAIHEGETLGLVGESGCGKTTLGRTILRLHEPTSGTILYRGEPIYQHEYPFEAKTVTVRGQDGATVEKTELIRKRVPREKAVDMLPYRRKMQIIFQDPSASLDPRMTVGEIIGEAIDIHKLCASKAERTDRIKELLGRVGLNTEHANRYPHEFSGGQQQRVGIARALAVKPEFIVCDEPISALDVSIQSQVVNMLEDMQQELGLTYLFIAHDLSVVRHISRRIGVMYLGTMVELAESYELNKHPLHPYTKTLLSAVPVPDPEVSRTRQRIVLEGDIPSPINPPTGCRFHTRCPYATEACKQKAPAFKGIRTRPLGGLSPAGKERGLSIPGPPQNAPGGRANSDI
ncbi:MAG: ABC transporter ATP-binding protein [Intestinimonas sp.]